VLYFRINVYTMTTTKKERKHEHQLDIMFIHVQKLYIMEQTQ